MAALGRTPLGGKKSRQENTSDRSKLKKKKAKMGESVNLIIIVFISVRVEITDSRL